ncbi:TonB-dependent receptor plug domain-containing protein [Aliidiomarina soli]|uniref:TonB-dependent receptor plug domain-containing protein n=1 Tax=Aliidiomarina soli TaxID=1928574 RepID=A0A432WGP3_9GAMM|nr:TonB-dependent receptor plug domain-containing protein [Aliidiomarina soli]RUO32982.1 hypothetical protein CWE14_06975 [Aliidiomarina soli]
MWAILLALAAADIERIEVQGRAAQHDAVVLDVASGYRSGETMADILRHAPGLQVRQTGGPGGALSLSMQGSGSSQVLVLLDGVPLTSTTLGTPLLQFLDPAEVASVEVISGAAAAAYGSGAMSGVVHIRTRADGDNVIAASQLRGDGDTAGGHGYLRLSQQLGRSQFAVSAALRDERYALPRRSPPLVGASSERSTVADYQAGTYSINFERLLNSGNGLHVRHQRQYTDADYQQDCVDAVTFAPLRCQPWLDNEQSLTQVEHVREQGKRQQRLSLSHFTDQAISRDHLSSAAGWSGAGDLFSTKRWRAAYLTELETTTGSTISRGFEWQRERVQSNVVDYQRSQRSRLALFSQWQSSQGSGFAWRVERMGSGSWVVSAQAKVKAQLTPHWSGAVALANGYREPGFNDLYWPGAGNPDLAREKSQSVQVTLKTRVTQGIQFRLQPFYQRWRRLIAWAPGDNGLWAPQNIDRASSRGVTAAGDWQLSESVSLQGHLTWQRARDDDSNQRLAYRAGQHAQLRLTQQGQRLRWSLSGHGRNRLYTSEGEALPGYLSLDAELGWLLRPDAELSLRASNLSNQRYAERRDWFEPGRQLRLGFTWRY